MEIPIESEKKFLEEEQEEEEMPHYMIPNFCSILPEYTNAEVDQIRSAFSTGNFNSIHRIPNKIAPNAVTQARFEQMDANRLSSTEPRLPKMVTKNGLFSQFDYNPSRYSLAEELQQMERLESEAKRMEISGKDFVASGQTQKLKYEDSFGDTSYRYPHLEQPYPDLRNEKRQERWMKKNKILHGAFVPSSKHLPTNEVTRKLLPEIIKQLHEVLVQDWEDCEFSISPTMDDNISIRFTISTLECETGLIAYMNVFSHNHRITSKYNLVKVVEDWNSKPGDGGLYFVFRPPWAKNRSKEHTFLGTDYCGADE